MTEDPTPSASRRLVTRRIHSQNLTDAYAWLRNKESVEVIDHLKAENRHVDARMRDTEALQKVLFDEIKGRMDEVDRSVPIQVGPFLYYYRHREGFQYSVYCRCPSTVLAGLEGEASDYFPDAPDGEQILLDLNEHAADGGYLGLGVFKVSPDHRLLAYSLDRDGSESYEIFFKDLETGEAAAKSLPGTAGSAEWLNDSRTLIYTTRDAAHRPYRAFSHRLGSAPADDRLLFEETDERYFLSLYKTRSRRFVVLNLGTHTTTEVHVLDADEADELAFSLVAPRRDDIEWTLDHRGDWFYLVTNRDAADYRVLTVPVASPTVEGADGELKADELLAERPGTVIEELACFADHLVLNVRRDGLKGLEIRRFSADAPPRLGAAVPVPFDEVVYTVSLLGNAELETGTLRFSYASFLTPPSVFDLDMESHERLLRKQDRVDGFDPSRYVCERLTVTAADGAEIPVSMIRPKEAPSDGTAPLLLYGYGSYGTTIEPRFSLSRPSLLDRGIGFAIAHVRGGGARGRSWYEAGKLAHKERTFSDFETVAEALIERGYTCKRRLMMRGGSAGGMLVGAVLNRRPDLFHAAVAEVPFVDVLSTMLDPTLPLTVIEYGEWGNPTEDPEAFDTIRAYSPYDNVGARAYPHLLVTAGLHDPRVQYWEPAKWVAKLRELKTDANLLLLRTDMGSGHGGASGRYDALEQEAFKCAFLLKALASERADDGALKD